MFGDKKLKKHTVTFPDWNMFFLKIKTSVCIFYFCTIENVSLLKCLFVFKSDDKTKSCFV